MVREAKGKGAAPGPISLPSNASATITLAKPDFSVGEVLQGQLVLNVRGLEEISCEGLTITLKGLEEYEWQISSDDSWEDRKASKQFLHQEVHLPISLEKRVAPGQHVFPFEFPLAVDLPPSFRHDKYQFSTYLKTRGSAIYTLDATMRLPSVGLAHATSLPVAVHAMTSLHAPPIRPLTFVETKRAKFFCCFDIGTCELSVTGDTDTYDLHRGVVAVRVTVLNGTKLGVTSLDIRLRREMKLHVPDGCGHQENGKAADDLGEYKYHEPIPAGTKRENIPVQFLMSQAESRLPAAPRLVPNHPASPVSPKLVPTCTTSLSSVAYHVLVVLRFATNLCNWVWVEVPIVLEHFPLTDRTIEPNAVELQAK